MSNICSSTVAFAFDSFSGSFVSTKVSFCGKSGPNKLLFVSWSVHATIAIVELVTVVWSTAAQDIRIKYTSNVAAFNCIPVMCFYSLTNSASSQSSLCTPFSSAA